MKMYPKIVFVNQMLKLNRQNWLSSFSYKKIEPPLKTETVASSFSFHSNFSLISFHS